MRRNLTTIALLVQTLFYAAGVIVFAQFIAVCSGLRLNCELRISDPVQR